MFLVFFRDQNWLVVETHPGHGYSGSSVDEVVEGFPVLAVDELRELRQQRALLVGVQEVVQADDQVLHREPPRAVIRQKLRERGSLAPGEDDSRLLLHHGGGVRGDGVDATPVSPLVRTAPWDFEEVGRELIGRRYVKMIARWDEKQTSHTRSWTRQRETPRLEFDLFETWFIRRSRNLIHCGIKLFDRERCVVEIHGESALRNSPREGWS